MINIFLSQFSTAVPKVTAVFNCCYLWNTRFTIVDLVGAGRDIASRAVIKIFLSQFSTAGTNALRKRRCIGRSITELLKSRFFKHFLFNLKIGKTFRNGHEDY